jgi:hypothetical protein
LFILFCAVQESSEVRSGGKQNIILHIIPPNIEEHIPSDQESRDQQDGIMDIATQIILFHPPPATILDGLMLAIELHRFASAITQFTTSLQQIITISISVVVRGG